MLTGTCFRTKAWSATIDDNRQITWCPQKIGPDELRECLPYFFTRSQKNTMMANDDGNTARAHGNMYEDDPSPEDYDGGDWDEDWDSDFPESPPPRHGRGNTYASDYEQSDRYEHSPEPLPRSRRQRNPYTDSGHGDSYQHIPEPLPRSGRPRNPFTNNFDPRGRYQSTPEPTPRRDSRRSSYANDYARDFQYEDFSPRGGNNNRRRHTFGPENDLHGRFEQARGSPSTGAYPRDRDHGTRNGHPADPLRRPSRSGFRLPAGMPLETARNLTAGDYFRLGYPMANPYLVPRSMETGPASNRFYEHSAMYQDAMRGRPEARPRSGKFWRVVRSFFGHTT